MPDLSLTGADLGGRDWLPALPATDERVVVSLQEQACRATFELAVIRQESGCARCHLWRVTRWPARASGSNGGSDDRVAHVANFDACAFIPGADTRAAGHAQGCPVLCRAVALQCPPARWGRLNR